MVAQPAVVSRPHQLVPDRPTKAAMSDSTVSILVFFSCLKRAFYPQERRQEKFITDVQ